MDIKINVEGKFKQLLNEETAGIKTLFWRELEKLRKRIVVLEMEKMDCNKLKLMDKIANERD
jgi:hypothetical protein